ncbi:MAG: hypothetical protein NUV72_01550, partial [Bauldia sp.]|nr:hypothetical protein [Bauldia sp.]
MKSGIPWNLKRVDEETRRAVIDAARRQGLSVGEWLNQVLAEEGEGYAEPEGIDPGAGEATDAPGDLATAISQIRSRLKQIEESVAQSAERHRPVADRRRSPKSVQEMIADLAREIENPDARARSTVEGPGARSPAPPAEPEVGRVNDAIRDLDRKIAAMGRRIAEPPPEDVKPARLDDIRYHLNALLARAPTPARSRPSPELPLPQAVLIDAALRALESRIDDAKAQLDARAGDASATAEQIARVEARLAEIGNRLAATNDERQRPRKEADLASAIREISSHQRAIDDRAETLAMRRDQKALAAAMAALRADIATLGEQVNAITRVGAEEHGAIFDIARRIDALAADSPLDRNLLAAIRDDLETMRATIDGSARQSTLGNVEERSDRVAAQINDLLTRTPDRARIETLGEEVAQLRRALEADDSPRAIQRLEMRVAELGRAIEAALSARQAPPQSDPALERLETRLQEIAGRIEVLRDDGTQAAAIATAERRLEGRLADIAGR